MLINQHKRVYSSKLLYYSEVTYFLLFIIEPYLKLLNYLILIADGNKNDNFSIIYENRLKYYLTIFKTLFDVYAINYIKLNYIF